MSNIKKTLRLATAAAAFIVALGSTTASAQTLGFASPANPLEAIFAPLLRGPQATEESPAYLPPKSLIEQPAARSGREAAEDASQEDLGQSADLPANLRRQVVDYPTQEPAGTVVIDTPHTYLYYVLGGGRAIRYGIGIGREGFTWSGVEAIARKAEWPDWTPPTEMIARQPYLPRFMAGGPSNPLGARAMYLGNTLYRIHGTNAPDTIGKRVSSGCIRLTNADVADLYSRVNVGTRVVVLPMSGRGRMVQAQPSAPSAPRVN
ncbi:MAG: L,D-transpeptidase [Xanthobacteraceae bacterium]|nr:L,D-transpeptidase [Xanthobacteraceae bacterium]MBV9627895.1 L,D-transpeptidase [Xanthobacteraceae bacterium]